MCRLLLVLMAVSLVGAMLTPAHAARTRKPPQWAAVSAAARTSVPPGWCYLKGRRGDPQLFLQQQARGCF